MGRPRLPLDPVPIVTAYLDGESVFHIARRLHISRERVQRALEESEVELRTDDQGRHLREKFEAQRAADAESLESGELDPEVLARVGLRLSRQRWKAS
jgi:DNA-binding transcriptional MocR family regulator